MKKHVKKLSLNRETLHRLTDVSLARAAAGLDADAAAVDKNLSITVCTNVISDCLTCTQPAASCPPSMQTYCTCA
jgi:hypothetical protein